MLDKSSNVRAFTIEGQTISIRSIEDAVAKIIDRLKRPKSFLVFTLNLDHLVKLRDDKKFRDAYRNAEFVTADGFPVVTLAGLAGIPIERTAGSDLIEPLCRAAATNGLSVFFLGTTLPALGAVARQLTTRIEALDVRGIFSPPMGFDENSAIADEAIRVIRESGARICFVALSPPLQEIFAATAMKRTFDIAFVVIGAGLDFIAGTQTRCPPTLRQLNLEWAWRLGSNPKRLGIRYLRCAILFAELLGRGFFGGKSKGE